MTRLAVCARCGHDYPARTMAGSRKTGFRYCVGCAGMVALPVSAPPPVRFDVAQQAIPDPEILAVQDLIARPVV